MFRYTDEPRHPNDVHDHFADAALVFAFIWGICLVFGICLYAGLLS